MYDLWGGFFWPGIYYTIVQYTFKSNFSQSCKQNSTFPKPNKLPITLPRAYALLLPTQLVSMEDAFRSHDATNCLVCVIRQYVGTAVDWMKWRHQKVQCVPFKMCSGGCLQEGELKHPHSITGKERACVHMKWKKVSWATNKNSW